MNHFTLEEVQNEDISFSNEHLPEEEAFFIDVVATEQRGQSPFHIWVNGELLATFQTFQGMQRRANALIEAHHLERV